MSFEELLKHAAALPPQSAIFWELMIVDAAGVVHEGVAPLPRLHAVANAPIFSYDEAFFGHIVGGPLLMTADTGRQTAAVAVRILGGEKPGDIKMPPVQFARPMFDWREMQRWGISESRLPPGSEIYFREPTVWDRYKLQILAILAALLTQAALIGWLLHERQYRHRAELAARESMSELTFMNRRAAAGELSASIAHEVNQPLTGMVTRASAARRWLARETPDLERVRQALDQIIVAGHRTAEIVQNVRAMFKKDAPDNAPVRINRVVWAVLALVHSEIQKYQVEVQMAVDSQLPTVTGNEVQLQQVILNLVMNAIEAMHSTQRRELRIQSRLSKPDTVHVSIEDTGTGVDPSKLDQLFKPLFTTKARGMGMGLSICRSIIERHGGRIWASPGVRGGSVFEFELPASATRH